MVMVSLNWAFELEQKDEMAATMMALPEMVPGQVLVASMKELQELELKVSVFDPM